VEGRRGGGAEGERRKGPVRRYRRVDQDDAAAQQHEARATISRQLARALVTPEDCASHMRGHLGEEWDKEQRRKRAAISRMTVLYADEKDIPRRKDAEYSKIHGNSKGRGVMRTGAGAVRMRPHSCFCRACILADSSQAGRGMSNSPVVSVGSSRHKLFQTLQAATRVCDALLVFARPVPP
jgi:hypothetical protein